MNSIRNSRHIGALNKLPDMGYDSIIYTNNSVIWKIICSQSDNK